MSSDTSKVTREDVLKLMDEKKQVEAELEILYGVIKSHNADMDTPLVDSQGYPRSDIDVYQVRSCSIHLHTPATCPSMALSYLTGSSRP